MAGDFLQDGGQSWQEVVFPLDLLFSVFQVLFTQLLSPPRPDFPKDKLLTIMIPFSGPMNQLTSCRQQGINGIIKVDN